MSKTTQDDLDTIHHFLYTPTPKAWLEVAMRQIPLLLIDHAHCERKAALTALNFMSKYPEKQELVAVMSPLAREELLHFEKVMQLLQERNIPFGPLKPSGYAQCLHQNVSQYKRHDYLTRLSDELIVGAIIEARSCERFYALVPYFEDQTLARFYSSLFKAEARHFQDYLRLAKLYCSKNIDERIHQFLTAEKQYLLSEDSVFRFHGGVPKEALSS